MGRIGELRCHITLVVMISSDGVEGHVELRVRGIEDVLERITEARGILVTLDARPIEVVSDKERKAWLALI